MRRGSRVVLAIAVVAVAACKRGGDDTASSSSGGVDAGGFDKAALLTAFGQCALDGYRELKTSAAALDGAARAADAGATVAARSAAREAWKTAIDSLQRTELFQFGPAGPSTGPGGR